ncbi:hypothetical protein ACLOJK_030636 [Asimina triloba]
MSQGEMGDLNMPCPQTEREREMELPIQRVTPNLDTPLLRQTSSPLPQHRRTLCFVKILSMSPSPKLASSGAGSLYVVSYGPLFHHFVLIARSRLPDLAAAVAESGTTIKLPLSLTEATHNPSNTLQAVACIPAEHGKWQQCIERLFHVEYGNVAATTKAFSFMDEGYK